MIIKSSKEYHEISVFLLLLTIVLSLLLLYVTDEIGFAVIMLLPDILILRFWVSVGRTIVMSKSGCTIHFLWYHRTYSWETFKTKSVESYEKSIGYRQPYTAGAIFSPNRTKKPSWLMPAEYSMFVHPFSYIYVYFTPHTHYKKWDYRCPDIYVVDEMEFRKKLDEWNVEIQ